MDLNERILDKLDSIDAKLDTFGERIAVNEAKHQSVSGQIKLIASLVLAGITAAIGAFFEQFKVGS